MIDNAQRVRRGEDLIFAEVDGEAVAMSAAKGLCFGLDDIGLRVLQMIDREMSVTAICAQLVVEYDVDEQTCRRDVADLLARLEAEGLVKLDRAS